MKSLFSYTSYRDYLKDLCQEPGSHRGFQSQLARDAGCQAAYMSQVLKQKVHLTEDQVLVVAESLEFSEAETNFLLLLLRLEKAATEKLRKYLKAELSNAKAQQNNLSARVPADQVIHTQEDLGKYFSTWIPSCVHLLTSSDNYHTADKISERLRLPLKETKEVLSFLMKMNWVQKKGAEYHYAGGNIHIAKDSPIQSTMQATRRQLALNSMALNPAESIHYSSVFTLDPEKYEELQNLVGKFVQQSAKIVHSGGSDELFGVCVDLFRV